MATPALLELGRRLRARRTEAKLSIDELASAARLAPLAIARYEEGSGALGLAQLLRVARVLGTEVGQYVHSARQEDRARVEPLVLLKTTGIASLRGEDLETVAAGLRRGKAFAAVGEILGLRTLESEFSAAEAPMERPHMAGYALARRVRMLLPDREGPLRNVQRLIEERFNILVLKRTLSNPAILGAAARSGAARVIVINTSIRYEARRRTVLAHELAHQLADLREDDATYDIERDDRVWFENPPEEKRANAFATMLLAPEDSVREALGPAKGSGLGLAEAKALVQKARELFGLGPEAMAWHLHHLSYIKSEETAAALIRESAGDTLAGFEAEPRMDGLERRVSAAVHSGRISTGRARELLGLSPFDEPEFLEAT